MHDDVCIRLRNWDYTVKPWCHTPSSCYLLEVFMVEICDQGAVSPIMLCCYNIQWLKYLVVPIRTSNKIIDYYLKICADISYAKKDQIVNNSKLLTICEYSEM